MRPSGDLKSGITVIAFATRLCHRARLPNLAQFHRFVGRCMTMNVDIPDLPAALRSLIVQIPEGRVTTYGALAAALGSDSATRWVGGYVLEPHFAASLPVHRILRAGGELGLYYTRDAAEKRQRLESEGIPVVDNRVDLASYFFDSFQSARPLEALRTLQIEYARQLQIAPPASLPQTVGGVDLSYLTDNRAVAGYALIDVATRQLLWSTTLTAAVTFPYIPTFLSFRELPMLLTLVENVRRQNRLADMFFVDGNGILHDRRMGIASMLGIAADIATVGISKKLLCGRVDWEGMKHLETRTVIDGDEVLGVAIRSRSRSKPIFVSPGHRVDLGTAVKTASQLLGGHRLPEPTYWADKLSREEARRILAEQADS